MAEQEGEKPSPKDSNNKPKRSDHAPGALDGYVAWPSEDRWNEIMGTGGEPDQADQKSSPTKNATAPITPNESTPPSSPKQTNIHPNK